MPRVNGASLEDVIETPKHVAGFPVRTVEEPIPYVVLTHRGRDVLFSLSLLRDLSRLESGVDHLGHYGFSWEERCALEEAGLAHMDIRGGMWPTGLLISELLL